MNPLTIRLKKEARAIAVPWFVVILACALPLLPGYLHTSMIPDLLLELALCLGIPLLATQSLGNEFLQQTFPLLLSQPIDRMKVWREKWVVTIAALLTTTVPLYLAFRAANPFLQAPSTYLALGLWVIMTTCSATFWTLIARSTLGGLILNISFQLFILISFEYLSDWVMDRGHGPPSLAWQLGASLFYSAVMLWLGRRKLAHFQSAGGFAGPDLLTSMPDVMPTRIADLFRSRRSQFVLNLIRKEIRLLMPLWAITALFVFGWMVTAILNWFKPSFLPAGVISAIGLVLFPIVAIILAGTVSLGEEDTCGVQSWQVTLPKPAVLQWMTKLSVGLSAGLFCGFLIPQALFAFGRVALRTQFVKTEPETLLIWPALLVIFVLSFWSASMVRGTIRAVTMTVLAGGGLIALSAGARWAASQRNPVLTMLEKLTLDIVSRFQLNPWLPGMPFGLSATKLSFLVLLGTVPVAAVAIFQSYRLFRRQPSRGMLSMTRHLFPLVITTVLIYGWIGLTEGMIRPWYFFFQDVGKAFAAFHPDITKLDATHPVRFTVEDLEAASSISDYSRQWLSGATMTVVTRNERSKRNGSTVLNGKPVYVLSIHLARGSTCGIFVAYSPISSKYDSVFGGPCQ